MCGIVGYIGDKLAHPVFLDGLRQLEYRGYDSAGIAVYDTVYDNGIIVDSKALGQVKNLAACETLQGTFGIGHTRWATHGGVTVENTHPHFDTVTLSRCHTVTNSPDTVTNFPRHRYKISRVTYPPPLQNFLDTVTKFPGTPHANWVCKLSPNCLYYTRR